jgi:thiamine biosynthesis lipoprotein
MGSVLQITIPVLEAHYVEERLRVSFAEASRIERMLSVFDPASELSRLNRDAARGPVAVDAELVWLIQEARELSNVSGGTVDATVSPLTRFWRFCDDRNNGASRPPSVDEISALLGHVGFDRVVVDAQRGTVSYESPGVQLEFGSLGKGYAVDRVVQTLVASGVTSALVDFGSTTYALGHPPNEEAWRVGIRHPQDPNRIVSVAKLVDRAISTSGDDQQGIFIDGVRYGHIVDPRTGWPACEAVAASVIAPTALQSDALATAAFVSGPRDGMDLLRRIGLDGAVTGRSKSGRLIRAETPGWRTYSARIAGAQHSTRRRVLVGMAAAIAAIFLRPALGDAIVYMNREEALASLIPEASSFTEDTVPLSAAERERLSALTNRKVPETEVTFWIGEQAGRVVGYATVLNIIGKEQPITFMVAVSPEGTVRGVQVMTYRESQGSEIRSKRFLDQFRGKTLAAPLKLGRDVHGISGATLSARSTAAAVKKALALVAVLYGTPESGP